MTGLVAPIVIGVPAGLERFAPFMAVTTGAVGSKMAVLLVDIPVVPPVVVVPELLEAVVPPATLPVVSPVAVVPELLEVVVPPVALAVVSAGVVVPELLEPVVPPVAVAPELVVPVVPPLEATDAAPPPPPHAVSASREAHSNRFGMVCIRIGCPHHTHNGDTHPFLRQKCGAREA